MPKKNLVAAEKKLTCLYCDIHNPHYQYHEIFDEIGKELKLQALAAQYLELKVKRKPNESQVLCDECVNYLISLYDIDELSKQRQADENEPNQEPTAKRRHSSESSLMPSKKTKVTTFESNTTQDLPAENNNTSDTSVPVVVAVVKSESNLEIKQVNINSVLPKVVDNAINTKKSPPLKQVSIKRAFQLKAKKKDKAVKDKAEVDESATSTQDTNISAFITELVNDDIEFISVDKTLKLSGSENDEIEEIVYAESAIPFEQQEEDTGGQSDLKQLHIEIVGMETDSDENNVNYTINQDENSNTDAQDEIELFTLLPFTDDVDPNKLNAYIDCALTSKLETLKFKWTTTCKFCELKCDNFETLFTHMEHSHQLPDESYDCPLFDCMEKLIGKQALARHLIVRHGPLHDLQIYGYCPHCNMTFSNFLQFNKHSCARMIKRRRGMRWFCEMCCIDFPSMKRFVFHMQFHMDKCRPRACFVCDFDDNSIEKLFEHVQYSHEPEGTLACVICDRTFRDKTTFNEHKHNEKRNGNYECKQCQKNFMTRSRLVAHLKQSHGSFYRCDFCSKEFAKEATYTMHLKIHVETEANVHVCSNCGLVETEYNHLLPHVQSEKNECFEADIVPETLSIAYICEHCSQHYKSKEDLRLHRSTGIHDDGKFWCTCCNKAYDSMRLYRNHTKNKLPSSLVWLRENICCRYMCNAKNGCEESYGMWNSLYTHKRRTHEGIKNADGAANKTSDAKIKYICQFCCKECPTKMSLSVHIARSHNNNNINCDECGASYRDTEALQKHIDFVHVPVECIDCGKIVKNQRNYEVHRRVVHLAEKRYKCEVCDKGFYHKSDMDAHYKVHRETHKCTECQFVTNYANSLQVHIASVHRNMYEFKCPHCARKFSRKTALNVHVRRHKDGPFKCADRLKNNCVHEFETLALLNKHIRDEHCKRDGTTRRTSTRTYANKQRADNIKSEDQLMLKDEKDNDDDDEEYEYLDDEYIIDDVEIETVNEDADDDGDEGSVEYVTPHEYEYVVKKKNKKKSVD